MAYIVTGLVKAEMWAVRTDGSGDVADTRVEWRLKTQVPKTASPVLVSGLIYTIADESFASCVDAATGNVVWSERMGGKFAASPIFADGKIYYCDKSGLTTVLKPGRTFEVLATNKLDDGFMASPAASGKALYLRTRSSLYRVESK